MSKIRVLFMQSQTYFGADSRIHSVLMKHFDTSQVEAHVACNCGTEGEPSAAATALNQVPNLHFRPTHFGPSVNHRAKRDVLRETAAQAVPALGSLGALPLYVRRHNIDIIHCTEKPRDAFYGLLLARLTGARCLVHLHVKAEDWISPLVQWSMKHADAVVGVSRFVAESAIAMGYKPEKTYHVLNGMETDTWQPYRNGAQIRSEFNISPDAPLLSIVSRLFYWKGHTLLLQALARVKQRVPDVKLLVVGEDDPRGHPGGGSYMEELKVLASELGLRDQVIFTGFRKDIPEILAASDLFTMPSFEEPFGMVFLEAMAMRKPVVALDNGGTREVVEHGQSGLLSAPEDVDGLAQNIIRLANDPALRKKMGEYGCRQATAYFTPRRMAHDMERVYRQVLDGYPAGEHPGDE